MGQMGGVDTDYQLSDDAQRGGVCFRFAGVVLRVGWGVFGGFGLVVWGVII